ncbi:MAG: chemotaxis protein CheA [Syntrophobacteraceae bacterium]|nr:chemotaxis protein CheA [Syntrophobacteraceae bacterium]
MMKDILDQLINGVIEGPDDLMGMGECLNLLDQLEGCEEYPERWAPNVNELRRLFNTLILEDSKDPDRDWESIRKLIAKLGANGGNARSPLSREEIDACDDREIPLDLAVDTSVVDGELELGEAFAETASEEVLEIQDPELIKDFIEESREHLAAIELNMLSLEANPKDKEAINAVFRPFHSVKGVAGFLNLKDIHHLSHEVENLLDAARSGTLTISDSVIDIVLQATDILKVLLTELEKVQNHESAVVPVSPVVHKFLERVRNFNESGSDGAGIPIRRVGEILVERGVVDEPALEKAVERSKSSGKRLGEELIEEGLVSATEVSNALREQRRAKDSAAFVRIDTQKLDNLVDMVGELVIAQSMVLQNPEVLDIKDQKLQKDTVQLNRITAELQRISMAMRMVPIRSTFQKMIRLVRDLAKKSGKEVNLLMRGEETEIDRNMVEEIYEPLVHMIRNAVDHGIETPEERMLQEKDPTGTVLLGAEQKGGNIVIDVQDDGKGLDAAKIRSKGIERGIISADDQLDEKSIYELILHPGFSTKEQVTDVSGRGVGMDVVKKNVEALRGKIEILSTYGKGTHFQVKLPLTMAIIDGMVIRIGEERYVVPTIAMKESLRPLREAYVTVQKRGEMIKVRDSLLPLIRLHRIFGVTPRYEDPWEALLLVVAEGKHSYCLLADEIVGRQEVVIKSLGGSLRNLKGVAGGAILGDGKVALIIDVKGVVSIYEEDGQ